MSDGIVTEGLRQLGEHGPAWIILLFIIVASVVVAVALVPTIKSWVEAKAQREAAEQKLARDREDRKREEMQQRAEKDGQMITLMAESNRVIERNSSAFRQVTASIESLNQQTAKLDSDMTELGSGVKELTKSVADLRIDVAGLKGEK